MLVDQGLEDRNVRTREIGWRKARVDEEQQKPVRVTEEDTIGARGGAGAQAMCVELGKKIADISEHTI